MQFTAEFFESLKGDKPPSIKGFDSDVWGFGKALIGGPNATFGEDCLNVNVWTPKPDTGEKKKAVLVWIYGGGKFSDFL
jgi:cholinesterase